MSHPQVYFCKPYSAIQLVTETGQAVEISIHPPSQFIAHNLERVLPDWQTPSVLWVVVILQQSQFQLVETTPCVEREKERLREKFMRFGCDLAFELCDRGFLTDAIDPRTGYPLLSRPGQISHNDTAVVKALLSFPIIHNNCRVLVHPEWGTAVYPSIIMSCASPRIIKSVLHRVVDQHGWKQPKQNRHI